METFEKQYNKKTLLKLYLLKNDFVLQQSHILTDFFQEVIYLHIQCERKEIHPSARTLRFKMLKQLYYVSD